MYRLQAFGLVCSFSGFSMVAELVQVQASADAVCVEYLACEYDCDSIGAIPLLVISSGCTVYCRE